MTLKERNISMFLIVIGYIIMVSVAREYIVLVDLYLFERRIVYISILIPIAVILCNIRFQAPFKNIYGKKALLFRMRQAFYFIAVMSCTSVVAQNVLINTTLIQAYMIQIIGVQVTAVAGMIVWYLKIFQKNAEDNCNSLFAIGIILYCFTILIV